MVRYDKGIKNRSYQITDVHVHAIKIYLWVKYEISGTNALIGFTDMKKNKYDCNIENNRLLYNNCWVYSCYARRPLCKFWRIKVV